MAALKPLSIIVFLVGTHAERPLSVHRAFEIPEPQGSPAAFESFDQNHDDAISLAERAGLPACSTFGSPVTGGSTKSGEGGAIADCTGDMPGWTKYEGRSDAINKDGTSGGAAAGRCFKMGKHKENGGVCKPLMRPRDGFPDPEECQCPLPACSTFGSLVTGGSTESGEGGAIADCTGDMPGWTKYEGQSDAINKDGTSGGAAAGRCFKMGKHKEKGGVCKPLMRPRDGFPDPEECQCPLKPIPRLLGRLS